MDNAGKNRIKEVFKLATNKRARLMFTVPNTPQLNLIELIFNKLKKSFRQRLLRGLPGPKGDLKSQLIIYLIASVKELNGEDWVGIQRQYARELLKVVSK